MIWFFSIFYVLGVLLVGFALVRWRRATGAQSWPSVAGTVTASELRRRLEMADETFVTVVEYGYRVDERAYRAERIAFDYDESDDKELHRRLHEHLPVGTKVCVHYDPARPADATLVTGATEGSVMILGFGVWWLTFAAGMHAFQVQLDADPDGVPWLPLAVLVFSTLGLAIFLLRSRCRHRDLVAALQIES